jgi:hypothetical protein
VNGAFAELYMTELLNWSWRSYPAVLFIAVGLTAAVWSAYRGVARAGRLRDPWRALAIMQGFRLCVVSLALAAIGAAWWWQIGSLFGLALIIGGEELLESTVVITALKHPGTAGVPPASVARRTAVPRHRAARAARIILEGRAGRPASM